MDKTSLPFRLFSGIVTFVMVTVISVLVWIYAESRTIRTSSIDMNVVVTTNGDPLFQVTPEQPQHVRLTLKASGSGVAAVEQRVLKGPVRITLKDTTGPLTGITHQTISLREDIEAALLLNEQGVTLVDIQPKALDLTLTPIDTVRRPVKFLDPYDLAEPNVKLYPNEVEVRAPAPSSRQLAVADPVVRLTPDMIENPEPGKSVEIDLPVDVQGSWGGRGFQIRPATVRATLVITRRVETLKLTKVPIVLQIKPEDAGKYRVAIENGVDAFSGVKVTGPVELVERVRKAPDQVNAVVRLTPELLAQAVDGRLQVEPVLSGLPQGVVATGVERVWVRVEMVK
jgi:hypothetical protein